MCTVRFWLLSEDLSEDLVYDLTKTMWEHSGELSGMLSCLNDFSLEKALDGITTEYHPGAIKYYQEVGIM